MKNLAMKFMFHSQEIAKSYSDFEFGFSSFLARHGNCISLIMTIIFFFRLLLFNSEWTIVIRKMRYLFSTRTKENPNPHELKLKGKVPDRDTSTRM